MRENNEIDGEKKDKRNRSTIHSFIMDNCQLLSSSSSFGCHLKFEIRMKRNSFLEDIIIIHVHRFFDFDDNNGGGEQQQQKKTSTGTNIMKMK